MSAKEIILRVLKNTSKPLTPKEIQEKTGLNYNTIRGRLYELKRKGLIKRVDNGWIAVS